MFEKGDLFVIEPNTFFANSQNKERCVGIFTGKMNFFGNRAYYAIRLLDDVNQTFWFEIDNLSNKIG